MCGKNIIFDDKIAEKKVIFTKTKKVIKIDDIDVNKILVSRKEPYDTNNSVKYFIGYNDDVIRLLCIKLPQMIGYIKSFDSNKNSLSRLLIISYQKITPKYGKKSAV